MNNKFDELTKSLARSVTRRVALKQFSVGLAFIRLARFGLVFLTLITVTTQVHAQGGTPLWTNIYSVPAGNASARAIAVDNSGNVFVTGTATPADGGFDYVTIKYSSAGEPLWTNRCGWPNSASVSAIAVDRAGDVVVTGSTSEALPFAPGWRYATIKYSSSGVPLWTNLFSGPFINDYANALAVDGSGNVFVTGESSTGPGHAASGTIKYSGAGVPLWTNFYHGPASSADFAHAMAVDSNGNAFVTGGSIDSNGRYYETTIKLSSTGALLWTRSYHGPANGRDSPHAIAVDRNGNVFVTGESENSPGLSDYATIGYSNSGVPLWTNRYHGPGNNELPPALAVDCNGNVFVTGGWEGSAGVPDYDYATIKYSNSGVPLWTNLYEVGASYGARALAVDGSGNVFVTGGSPHGIPTIAYSGEGVPLWTNRYPGGGVAWAMAVDSSGNVIVGGVSFGANDSFITIKYSGQAPVSSPPLNIQQFGDAVVLSWTNAAFGLQSAPVITGDFTNISGATSPFTNPISGPQQYFRLQSN